MKEKASNLWWSMPPEEWLNAFSAHPKIGKSLLTCSNYVYDNSHWTLNISGDGKALKEKFAHKNSWEGDEQSGANTATEEVLQALQTLNHEYDLKNGFIFLICATGKSALEMLDALQVRLRNDRETEVSMILFIHSTWFQRETSDQSQHHLASNRCWRTRQDYQSPINKTDAIP